MSKAKLNYLEQVKKRYSDVICQYVNRVNDTRWPEAKPLGKLTGDELEKMNLIRVLPNQIVLDIENLYQLNSVLERVKERNWGFEVWNTGSRGAHIYLEFKNLEEHTLEVRNRIRKYIITAFQTDEALAKESQFVSCPYAEHFKTGNIKTLIERKDAINYIPNEIIEYAKKDVEEKIVIDQPDEEFKNFIHDPYLLYALSNTIEDGERNDILFKNLSIGLVRSGLERDEIVRIAQLIINRCPGKSLAEFMGWVDKAYKGEITEFNKFELIKWAEKYGYPILYSIEELKKINSEEADSIFGIEVLWNILWDGKIAIQPVWKQLCLFNLLGTVVQERDKNIDYRIHVIFSSPPGSGKDEGINVVENILKIMEYKTHRPSSATDRTLVGSINQIAIEMNTKNAEKIESGNKKKAEEVEFGILGVTDWLAFGESESVFKPSQWNRQLHIVLRQTMDKNRTIERGVGGRMIPIYTNTSIILTTYSMDEAIYRLLNNGLFQRALFYDRELTDYEHREIRKKISSVNFDQVTKDNYNEKEIIDKLIIKLRQMKKFYDENKFKIQYFKGCSAYVESKWDKYEDEYKALNKFDRNIMNAIVRRGGNNLQKLLVLNAIKDFRTTIEKSDVDSCFRLIMICANSVKNLVLRQDKLKKQITGVLKILEKGEFPKMRVYDEMELQLDMKSADSKKKLVDRMVSTNRIYERIDGNMKYLGITEEGKLQLELE